jgi:hypothetical protein
VIVVDLDEYFVPYSSQSLPGLIQQLHRIKNLSGTGWYYQEIEVRSPAKYGVFMFRNAYFPFENGDDPLFHKRFEPKTMYTPMTMATELMMTLRKTERAAHIPVIQIR